MRKQPQCIARLINAGIERNDAIALRRIAMTLHRWHELECGTDGGCIERCEKTGRPYWYNANARYVDPQDPRCRTPIADREGGARKRLNNIMSKYLGTNIAGAYVQGDPRGAALYILRKGDVPEGQDPDAYYSRGIAVYR
jgi:hypothetical protein